MTIHSKQSKKYLVSLNRQGKLLYDAAESLWKNRKDLISANNIGEDPFGNFFHGRFRNLNTDHIDALEEAVNCVLGGYTKSKKDFFRICFTYYKVF
jgi:hypothetical protein